MPGRVARPASAINPAGSSTAPLAARARRAVWKLLPFGLVLRTKSLSPAVPISARPDQPVWNRRLAVSPAAALLIFS